MDGNNKKYDLTYSINFEKDLSMIIDYWDHKLGFTPEKISKFVSLIRISLENLRYFPYMYQDVSDIYNFDKITYRILIGKQYSIFYRVNEDNKEVLIDSIFYQKRMKSPF